MTELPFLQSFAGLALILMLIIFTLGLERLNELLKPNKKKGDIKMGSKTPQKESRRYYVKVMEDGTIYVWGFNYRTIITRETIDKAYRAYHTPTYDRKYYDNKLKEGEGKPGSDCSGMDAGLSGYDTTAQGYYDRSERKGPISTLPLHDLVLLFKGKSSKSIKHTGIYLGDGMCIHMKSSAENCVYESVDKHGWSAYGYADFIDYSEALDATPVIYRLIKMGSKGTDVKLLQEQLTNKGYACGKIDGDFGTKTDSAVKKFQKANKLTVDGIVGKNTAKKLGMIWNPV